MNMEYLFLNGMFIWIGTVLTSFGTIVVNDMRKYKDAAEKGYKLNVNRYDYNTNKIAENKKLAVILLLPVVNVIYALINTVKYYNEKHASVNKLLFMNCLVPMNEDEKKEYNDNPCILNAMKISMNIADEKPINDSIKFDTQKLINKQTRIDNVKEQERLIAEREILIEEYNRFIEKNKELTKEFIEKVAAENSVNNGFSEKSIEEANTTIPVNNIEIININERKDLDDGMVIYTKKIKH
jgi:hypothetical protein